MKRRTTRRRNSGGKTVSLRNFTGKVRRNPDGTVTILGTGKKANPSRRKSKREMDRLGRFLAGKAGFKQDRRLRKYLTKAKRGQIRRREI